MKKLLLFACLVIGLSASAQYTTINSGYDWIRGKFRAINIPFGCGYPSLQTGQYQGSSAIYLDTCFTGGRGRLYYKQAGTWQAVMDSTTVAGLIAAGGGGGGHEVYDSIAKAYDTLAAHNTRIIANTTAIGTKLNKVDSTAMSGYATQYDLTQIIGGNAADSVYIRNDTLFQKNMGTERVVSKILLYNISSLANNDLLKYNSGTGKWQNFAPSFLTNVTGLITEGDNINITGTGTSGDPYVINTLGANTIQRITDYDDLRLAAGNVAIVQGRLMYKQYADSNKWARTAIDTVWEFTDQAVDLEFVTSANNLQESPTNTYTYISTTGVFTHALATTNIPSATEGRISFYLASTDVRNVALGFMSSNTTPSGSTSFLAAVEIDGAGNAYYDPAVSNIGTATVGRYFGIYRNTSNQIIIQESTDGTNWTTFYSTGVTNSGTLYPALRLYGGSSAKIVNPKIEIF